MESRKDIEKGKFRRKVLGAAALLVIYACVVFSVPPERLAWQGSYVMGILLLPKVSPAPYVRSVTLAENADSSFSLIGFVSAAAILVLAIWKIPDVPRVRRVFRLDRGLRVPFEEKIRIMYIL